MKDLANIFSEFLAMDGQQYSIERNGNIVDVHDGLDNCDEHKDAYVGFLPGTDIKTGDWLINTSGEKFYVYDVKTVYINHSPNELQAFYETESSHNRSKQASISNTFNVSNVNNSVIGNYNSATISYNDALMNLKNTVDSSNSADKAELQEIIKLLEMILNDKVPASKGILSKFSEVMERNSWITSSVAGVILSWLTNHI